MKAKQEEPNLLVTIGWTKIVLPRSKAYQLHTLLSEALMVDDTKYLSDLGEYLSLLAPASTLTVDRCPRFAADVSGVVEEVKKQYIDATIARAALMGKAFTMLSFDEWKEGNDGTTN